MQTTAVALSEQFNAQMLELDKVTTSFDGSVGKQIDVLTSVTDRLQVIAGSLTAFRDAMNAAKFTDRLEEINGQQQKLHALTETNQATVLSRLAILDGIEQSSVETYAQLASLKKQNLLLQAVIIASSITLVALHFVK